MPAPFYEPQTFEAGRTNTPSEVLVGLTLVFGSSVLASTKGKNLSATRVTNGQYKVVLPKPYRRRTSFAWGWGKCAAGAVLTPVILTDNSTSATDPHFIIETRVAAGTATDPADTNQLDLTFGLTVDVLND